MNDKEFWDLIGWANEQGDHRQQREDSLEDELLTLPAEEIEDFYLRYSERVMAAWTKELKCAAYLIDNYGGGLDEGQFLWFVQWLIDRGKADYAAALANPDSLADVDEELPWGSDGYWVCSLTAWPSVTGRTDGECDRRFDERGASRPMDLPRGGASDRYLKKHYPRLYRRFAEEE